MTTDALSLRSVFEGWDGFHHGGQIAILLGTQGIEIPELGDLGGHLTQVSPVAIQEVKGCLPGLRIQKAITLNCTSRLRFNIDRDAMEWIERLHLAMELRDGSYKLLDARLGDTGVDVG